jgi:hypothetical protein
MQSYESSNSMQTQWTKPTSEAEIAYFSKKGKLLGKYRSAITGLSYLWMLFAFFGIRLGIAHVLEAMSLPGWLPTLLALALVTLIHPFLVEDTETYFFDKLDNDPATDSPWYIPALFILVVFLADRWGMQYLGERYGYVAKIESRSQYDTELRGDLLDLKQGYEVDVDDVNSLYDQQAKAAALPHRAIINDLKRKEKAKNQKYTSLISAEQRKLDEAVAAVEAVRSFSLESLRLKLEADEKAAKTKHSAAIGDLTSTNDREKSKQSASEALTNYGSWVVAIFFVLAFVGLNWRYCQMSIRCGVRPLHVHTPLDKYGGVKGWFISTLKDIWRRQAVRLAGIIHEFGTKGTADLSDLDTSVRFGQSGYNSQPPTPAPTGNNNGGNIRPLNGHKPTNNSQPPSQSVANNSAQNPVITGSNTNYSYSPTVINSAQKEIMDVIITIRPEFSNFNNPNHKQVTVWNRLERKFAKIDEIIERYTPELIGSPTIFAVEHERAKWLALENPNLKTATA